MFRNLKKPSFGIRARTIFLVTTVLVAALIVINIVWFTRVRSIITEQNEASQTQLGERAKLNIEEFINAKIRTLIVHSQTASFFDSTQGTP